MSKKRGARKGSKRAGYRVNGSSIYHVKGKTSSRRKTFKTKKSARAYLKRTGKR